MADLDDIAFLHQQAIKNTAFEMADGLAFGIDDDRAHCYRRTSKIGRIGPGEEPAESDADRCEACNDQPRRGGDLESSRSRSSAHSGLTLPKRVRAW
ncbi:hypothetical protein Q644_22390 [Brucella intermedia 229E]|uniref:Uncharacterized protein n=1 Tax=Brucella intermedia 229E TaxID=1337887 RepID=U4V9E2_9HYPH|nr:hypothetical protein Q644_22390 [Brucella intermedia 229E]